MTNKKLWLSLLAVVLIVCMLSVGLMSCKKKTDDEEEEEEEEEITVEEQAANAIVEGIQASLKAADMTDLKVDGEVGLTVGDKNYTLALALDLDLRQFNGYNYTKCSSSSKFDSKEKYFKKSDEDEDEYEEVKDLTEDTFNASKTTYYTRSKKDLEDDQASNTFLNAELREGNKVLLGVYYFDTQEELEDTQDVYTGDVVYVQFFDKNTNKTKKMKFPAPFVKAMMIEMGASVDFHGIKLDELDIWPKR